MKKSVLLRLAVSTALVALLVARHDLASAAAANAQALKANTSSVWLGLACMGLSILFSAVRWWLLLRPAAPELSFRDTLRITGCSWFFNITSLGTLGGDAYRVLALAKCTRLTKVQASLSIMVEHSVGLMGTLLLYALTASAGVVLWTDASAETLALVKAGGWFLLGLAVVLLLLLYSLSAPFLETHWHWTPRFAEPWLRQIAAAQVGFEQRLGPFLSATLVSVLAIWLYFLGFYFAVRAVGGVVQSIPVILAMPVVDILSGLPVSLSGLGVREQSFEFLMSKLTGLAPATSVAAALLGWLFTVAWGLLGGVAYIWGGKKA